MRAHLTAYVQCFSPNVRDIVHADFFGGHDSGSRAKARNEAEFFKVKRHSSYAQLAMLLEKPAACEWQSNSWPRTHTSKATAERVEPPGCVRW